MKTSFGSQFDPAAQLLKCLASPTRLKILHFLSQCPYQVETLAEKIDQSIANTSMHLQKLKSEQIVRMQMQGQKRIYHLPDHCQKFWRACQRFIIEQKPQIVPMDDWQWKLSKKQTLQLFKKQDLFILDVRGEDEKKHEIQGVHHFPFSQLKKNLDHLSKKKRVLVFCRAPLCLLSSRAALFLREHGFQAFWINDSLEHFFKGELK